MHDEQGDALTEAFDLGIDAIRQVQRSYSHVTKQQIPILEQEHLPLFIPVAVRPAWLDENEPTWPTGFSLFLVNFDDVVASVQGSEELSGDQLRALADSSVVAADAAFTAFMEMRREAYVACRNGSRTTSAILLGASCELLLREIHLLLLWEEGQPAADVAESLSSRTDISSLVKREFAQRLRGIWNFVDAGPIKDWYLRVAKLRNQAIHLGLAPRDAELSEAFEAAVTVERFLGDRLAANLDRFQIAAYLFLGDDGIDSRGLRDKLDLLMDGEFLPGDPHSHFGEFRAEVRRHSDGGPFEGSIGDSDVCFMCYPNGETRWWLVDNASRLACVAKNPVLVGNQAASLKAMEARIAEQSDVPGPVATALFGASAEPRDDPPRWQPWCEVMPLNRADRWPSSLIAP